MRLLRMLTKAAVECSLPLCWVLLWGIGCALLVSCGLPQDESVIFPNYVDTPLTLQTGNTEPILFENRDKSHGSRGDYDPSKVKGYNFFYRFYTEADYIRVAGGSENFSESVRRSIEQEAQSYLTQSNQHKLSNQESLEALNTISRPYYRFFSVDTGRGQTKEHFQKTGIHYPAPESDFQITSGLNTTPIVVQYQFILPTPEHPFSTVKKVTYNGQKVESEAEQKPVRLYRRVFDDKQNRLLAKDFFKELHYRTGADVLVQPDEDLSKDPIDKETGVFYVAYFVALTGMQITPTLKPLNSEVSLICVQKFSSVQMSPNPQT